MDLNWFDVTFFLAFILGVVAFSMYKSRKEENSEDYFLAGRGLKWYLIGFSIVAANISTEQFVGMSGQGAGNVGLSVSGYQLLGAVPIVFVALFFLFRQSLHGNCAQFWSNRGILLMGRHRPLFKALHKSLLS